MILGFAIFSIILSAIPAAMFLANLPLFRQFPLDSDQSDQGSTTGTDQPKQAISILIPARDEAEGIRQCVTSALANTGVVVEVIVLDDHSSDATPTIVSELADADERVRLIGGRELPDGWNGKQHACWQLSKAAQNDELVFLDADVRLAPHALYCLAQYRKETSVGLLSAFPNQVTQTWSEKWLIPMMHFILLGYLPFQRMRTHNDPGLAAGCGQLFITDREAYEQAGTHSAIRASRHDGIKLPRAYRTAGLMTDVVDGTGLAKCRMYDGFAEVARGVLKNATEGIANPRLIVLFSVLLLGCSLFPAFSFLLAVANKQWLASAIAGSAVLLGHFPRMIGAAKLQQSWLGALCHVPATSLFVLLQWIAFVGHLMGKQVSWRGRS